MDGITLTVSDVAKNYRAGSIQASWRLDAPDQLQILLDADQPTGLPVVDEVVKLFSRDAHIVFKGTIDEVGKEGIYVGSTHLSVPIRVQGLNLRMYNRITRHRIDGLIPVWRSVSATVSLSGTTVTRTDGDHFDVTLAGKTVKVNGSDCTVASVEDPDHLTLGAGPGDGAGLTFDYSVYSGDVFRDLMDDAGKYMEAEGFTFTEDSVAQGARINDLFFDPPVPVAEAVAALLELNPTFGAWIEVGDFAQVAHFRPKVAVISPVSLVDGSGRYRRDISLSTSREDVRNVEVSVMDPVVLVTTKKTFELDGTTKCWFVDRPVGTMVKMYFGTLDTPVEITFGEQDSGAKFMYHKGSCAIWQNPDDPAHVVGDGPLNIEYYPLGDNLQEAIDSADVGRRSLIGANSGRIELVVDRTASPGQVEAFAEATGSIARFKDDLRKVKITTWEYGLRPGNVVEVQTAKLGIGEVGSPDRYYIETVTATDKGVEGTEHDLIYTLDGVDIARLALPEAPSAPSRMMAIGAGGPRLLDEGTTVPDTTAKRITAAEVFRSFRSKRKLTISGGGGARGSNGSLGHFDRTILIKDAKVGNDVTDHVILYGAAPGEIVKFVRITGTLRKTITSDLTVRLHLKYSNEDHEVGTFTIPSTQAVDDPISWLQNDAALLLKQCPDRSVVYGDVTVSDGSKDVNGIASFTIEYGSQSLPQDMAGQGLPAGGDSGLVLTKLSNTSFDVGWRPTTPSTLTTKGDLMVFDTVVNRLPVGADGKVLTADSTQASGVKWSDLPAPVVEVLDLLATSAGSLIYLNGETILVRRTA